MRPYFFQGTVTRNFMQADRKEFTDLLKRILSIDQKLRITPRKVLVHPFFSPTEQLETLRKQTWGRQRACRLCKKEDEKQEREKTRQKVQACRLHKTGQRSR
jgi:hypothetical protein